MVDWTAGLLGGVAGGAKAVQTLSEERRRELAEQLKREALEAIAERSDARRHGYDKELQETDIAARDARSQRELNAGYNIAQEKMRSSEKIAGDRNAMMEKIANMENRIREKRLSTDKDSNEAAIMNAQIRAFTEARKIGENGGSTDEMNAVLTAAGLPPLEDFEITPAKPGFLGFGDEPAVMGRRPVTSGMKPAGDQEATSGQAPTGMSAQLASLLEASQGKTEPGTEPERQDEGILRTSPRQDTPEPVDNQYAPRKEPGTKGLLESEGTQQPEPEKSIPQYSKEAPESWSVVMIGTSLSILTPNGPVKMTPEQIEAWKQTEAGRKYFSKGSVPLQKLKDTGAPDRRREAMRKSFS